MSPRKFVSEKIAPRKLPPGNYPQENCPRKIATHETFFLSLIFIFMEIFVSK